jgi:hypothetical protein
MIETVTTACHTEPPPDYCEPSDFSVETHWGHFRSALRDRAVSSWAGFNVAFDHQ